jgi:hypothetical protein
LNRIVIALMATVNFVAKSRRADLLRARVCGDRGNRRQLDIVVPAFISLPSAREATYARFGRVIRLRRGRIPPEGCTGARARMLRCSIEFPAMRR